MAYVTPGGHGLGVRWGTPDPRTYTYTPQATTPPPDISLRGRQQRPTNQGQIGSCTGEAGANGVEGIAQDGPRSALYVYYYDRLLDGTPPTTDAGATMLSMCKALQQYGVPPESAWPYDVNRFSERPPASADAQALKIESYAQVTGAGLALLQGTWAALREAATDPGMGILLALDVYAEFEQSRPDGIKQMPLTSTRPRGGHAIEVTDWSNNNAAVGSYGYVGCQGSWGDDFDDGGYHWLPAQYFLSSIVREVWVIRRAATPPPPEDNVDAIREKVQQLRDLVAQAQTDRCAWGATRAQYQASMAQIMDHDIGPLYDVAQQIEDLLPKPPGPGPEPGPQFVAPLDAGAIYGVTKWYQAYVDAAAPPGADLFCRRGAPVYAPCDGVIEEVIPGQSINGGAEVIMATTDKAWAFRFRHVQTALRVGVAVKQGQAVATVGDSSLDRLGRIPVAWQQWSFPDGWQHLDLSVDKGTDRFSPAGGGGGNYSAPQWLQEIGYQGTRISRTPGPPDAGMGAQEAVRFLNPRRDA